MKRAGLSSHLDAFRSEAQMLLRFQLAFNRILKFHDLKQMSRSDFVDRLIALKAIENDMLIRICKFDDATKGVHSFPKARNEVPDGHVNKTAIYALIEQFSRLISDIKHERRHTQLAHLKIGVEDNEYDVRYDFTPAIRLIVEIIDLMNIGRVSYKWKDGQYEQFDLRSEIFGNSVDFNP